MKENENEKEVGLYKYMQPNTSWKKCWYYDNAEINYLCIYTCIVSVYICTSNTFRQKMRKLDRKLKDMT